jgi:hypothetical protein
MASTTFRTEVWAVWEMRPQRGRRKIDAADCSSQLHYEAESEGQCLGEIGIPRSLWLKVYLSASC